MWFKKNKKKTVEFKQGPAVPPPRGTVEHPYREPGKAMTLKDQVQKNIIKAKEEHAAGHKDYVENSLKLAPYAAKAIREKILQHSREKCEDYGPLTTNLLVSYYPDIPKSGVLQFDIKVLHEELDKIFRPEGIIITPSMDNSCFWWELEEK